MECYMSQQFSLKYTNSRNVSAKTHIGHDIPCTSQLASCRLDKQSLCDIQLFTNAIDHTAERNDIMAGFVL